MSGWTIDRYPVSATLIVVSSLTFGLGLAAHATSNPWPDTETVGHFTWRVMRRAVVLTLLSVSVATALSGLLVRLMGY